MSLNSTKTQSADVSSWHIPHIYLRSVHFSRFVNPYSGYKRNTSLRAVAASLNYRGSPGREPCTPSSLPFRCPTYCRQRSSWIFPILIGVPCPCETLLPPRAPGPSVVPSTFWRPANWMATEVQRLANVPDKHVMGCQHHCQQGVPRFGEVSLCTRPYGRAVEVGFSSHCQRVT